MPELPEHERSHPTPLAVLGGAAPAVVTRPEGGARSGGIDAVRVLAVVAVVLGHVWANSVVYRLVFPWHVAVFFFLAGYLWSPGRTLRTEFVRRWRSLAVPYLVWLSVLLAGVLATRAAHGTVRLHDVLPPLYGGVLATRPFSAYWFLTVLFFVAVLTRLVERLPVGVRATVAVLGLTLGYVAGPLLAATPLAIGSALPCLSFLVLGQIFAAVRPRISLDLLVGLAAATLASVLVWTGAARPLNIKLGDYGTPVLSLAVAVLYCGALVLVADRVFRSLGPAWSSAATLLASAGLTVVLTHAAVLEIFDVGPAGSFPVFVAALTLPWAVGLVLHLTPVSPVVNGVPARTRRQLVAAGPAVEPG